MQAIYREIYQFLYQKYGPQGWWPVTPIGGCRGEAGFTPVYGIGPKNERQRLEIIFGAILTQNTAWKNVEKAIVGLNMKGLIDIDKIRSIRHEELAEAIKSSGYFNEKAKKLKNVSGFLIKHPISRLQKSDTWKARELLLSVSGIGPETADSILLYALNKPVFVVDAYTRRIFGNLGLMNPGASYGDIQKTFMDNLPHDADIFNEYHALIVEHAKHFYQKKTMWKECPPYRKYGISQALP
ncbi:MAG: endonuclease III domain-containing protein [archaeon]